ncbi:MAG: hypothetical protein IT285_05460 [Bdellovibrionales bacterium]|nr:hypothetical protein [Bdellovibrionales bacterium]
MHGLRTLFLSLVAALFCVLAGAGAWAGGPMIEVSPISGTVGVEASWGACPCLRWSVQVEAAGGQIETRDFLISSDALFQFMQEHTLGTSEITSQMMTFGAIEALWKGGHIGLGFDGVTIGDDVDMAYNDIFRTGLHALINVFRTEAARLDIRSGWEMEVMRINAGPSLEQHDWNSSISLGWNTGVWSGNLSAYMGVPMNGANGAGPENWEYGGSLENRFRVLRISDIEMALGINVGAGVDPLREMYGLNPVSFTGMVFMELSWISRL